jgi:predicted RNA binding protein YcfA (HicA-like mRNA interferase family)
VNLDKLIERLKGGWRPKELMLSEVLAIYERMGWTVSKPKGSSHYVLRKAGMPRPEVVVPQGKKVRVEVVEALIRHLTAEK